MDINPAQNNPLPERQYYHDQIIGLQVQTTDGKILGNVADIITGQSNDNYIVRGDTGDILIPAIEDVIRSIEPEKGYIIIEAIEGLLDLNEKKHPK